MFIHDISIISYKNLKDFQASFTQNINVFIGQNGSGKSALIEVILEIFANLTLRPKNFSKFESTLHYNKGIKHDKNAEKSIQINTKDSKFWTSEDGHTADHTVLNLSKIVVYYSGGNKILEKLVSCFNREIKAKNAKTSVQLPTIFYIDDNFYKICLVVAQISNLQRFKTLLNRYGIEEKKFEFGFKFFNNSFINKQGYSTKSDSNLLLEILNARKNIERGKIAKLSNDRLPVTHFSFINFQLREVESELMNQIDERTLINQFIRLIYEDELIKDIRINCYKNGKYISNENTVDQNSSIFSEGEKQRFVIECLGEIFPDGDTLFLLDEPDAFMHPQWQSSFIKEIVKPMAEKGANFIITTHSPFIIQNLLKESVFMIENGKVLESGDFSYGRDISTVSYEFMGVEERPKDIQLELDKLFEAIEIHPKEASKLYDGLVLKLGKDDRDLVYAKTIIDFS